MAKNTTPTGKDTLYIDVEDEITAVIDKVINSKSKIVAIVLPKRATVFHSAVNLKLLKKAAVSAKKNIALITSDASIIAIAGSVGIHVAKTPTSKPIIPAAITATALNETINLGDEKDTVVDTLSNDADDSDEIELDNTDTEVSKLPKAKKKKKVMKIPDFSKFTTRLWLGIGALVILIILWVIGFVILPKATVTINTDVSTTSINTAVTAEVGTTELDLENNIIPAERVQVEKIDSVTVEATGEKNIGNRATGTINLTNCIESDGVQVVPAGTRFSAGGVSFETTEQAILPEATFNASDVCRSKQNGDDLTVSAIAMEPGTQSNISSQSLNSSISGIVAVGSAMTGGTSETVKVISQADIDKARETLNGTSKNDALTELKTKLTEKAKSPIDESLINNEPTVVASPAVGAEAEETKVTMTVNYSMLGVNEEDLNKILDKEIRKNLGDLPVNIRDNGLESLNFTLSESSNEAKTLLIIETVATIGPEINQDQIKQEIVGKKRGDIEKQVESIEGVRSVSVEYSPAWITTTPKSADKISIIIIEGDDNQ
jgi:hypothetical protein